MEIRDQILIKILAETDYILCPVDHDNAAYDRIYEARHAYARLGGIPYRPDTKGAAEKKARERAFNELVGDGLAEVTKSAVKSSHCKLTCKGDQAARNLLYWPCGMEDMITFLKVLLGYREVWGKYIPEFLPELANLGENWNQEGLTKRQAIEQVNDCIDIFLLGAVRGLCGSKCDTIGRRYYYLTSEGEEIATGERTIEIFNRKKMKDPAGNCDYYWSRYSNFKDSIMSTPIMKRSEIWEIPLPAGRVNHKDAEG